jgi:hypothetical protein
VNRIGPVLLRARDDRRASIFGCNIHGRRADEQQTSFLFKLEERIPVSVVSADESSCVAIRFSRQQREENRRAPSLSLLKPHRRGFAAQTFAVDPVSSPRLWVNMLPP